MNEIIFKQNFDNFDQEIEKYRDKFTAIIPEGLKFDVVKSSIESEFIKNPELLLCSTRSIIAAVKTVVNVGLIPNSNTGQCYFVPFKNSKKNGYDLNVILGYRGLSELIYRSGFVKDLEVRAVFKGDDFSYEFGLRKDLIHKPNGNTKKEDLTHVYCIINLVSGGQLFDVMTLDEIIKVRDESANYKNAKKKKYETKTIWYIHFVEMAKKTILRRISKIAPLSVEVRNIIGIDESADYGKQKIEQNSLNDKFFDDVQDAEIVSDIIVDYTENIKEVAKIKTENISEKSKNALDDLDRIMANKMKSKKQKN